MEIVMVGQYYWPDNFLINEIAEEMVQRGHKVTVLTGLPDYATNYVPKEYKWGKKRHEIRNGVEIYRVPIISRHTGFFFRVLNYLSFYITSSTFAIFHKFEADVIMNYQTAPVIMGNAGIVLKKKLKKPLFFYCLDIWPDQMKVWGVGEQNPIFKIMRKYCEYAYGSGDLVGISSLPFKKYLINVNHVKENRIVYLPQHSARIELDEEQPKEKDCIDLIFAGNIGQQQNVECLLKAISVIETNKKYKVHIYGNGTSFETCRQLANELKISDRTFFYGRVSKEKLTTIYSKMDAFLLTLCSEKEIGFTANTVPAKFQGYLSVGKPVLASIDGGAKEIIDEIGCGMAVNSNDYIGYAAIMKEFIEHPDKYKECGLIGKQYFNDHYDKKVVMDQLEDYLDQLMKGDKNNE